jgi:hypothetical protein
MCVTFIVIFFHGAPWQVVLLVVLAAGSALAVGSAKRALGA